MGTSKVVFGGETVIDLTSDTVTASKMASGTTAHDAAGNLIVGTATEVNIVQETGDSETDVMSQAAVTEALGNVEKKLFDKVTASDALVWDGNTEGLQVFDMTGDGTYLYYPISGNVLTLEDLANGVTIETSDPTGVETTAITVNDFATRAANVITSRSVANLLFVSADNAVLYGNTIPTKGVYFLCSAEYGYVSRITVPGYTGFNSEVEVLKEKFLPEDYATKEEVSSLSGEIANQQTDIDGLTLGLHTDGLIYLFDADGQPQGNGIALPSGETGDVIGNVDSANNIVLNGDLADGTYTVKYETADGDVINIGSMVLDSNVYYSITKNLTNCTISNSATSIVEGESYSATITANSGYELSTVTVTMGGNAVTVSGGAISIASVTGNIVITAVAEEVSVEPVTENITLTDGLSIVATSGADRALAGYCATPHIDVSNIPKPCVIKLKKALWAYTQSSTTGYTRCYITDKNGNKLVGDYTHSSKMPSGVTMEYNDNVVTDVTITITSDNIGTLRFAGQWTGNYSDSNDRFADSNTSATLTYTPN